MIKRERYARSILSRHEAGERNVQEDVMEETSESERHGGHPKKKVQVVEVKVKVKGEHHTALEPPATHQPRQRSR